jgi:hypothetical protein
MASMTVTDNGRNLYRDGSKGSNNPKLLYIAIGTDSTAPSISDTKLKSESFRKAITSYANGASVGEILINAYIGPSEANGINIQEVGVFGGSTASSVANSGVLLARGLYSHTKVSTEGLTLQLDLQIS